MRVLEDELALWCSIGWQNMALREYLGRSEQSGSKQFRIHINRYTSTCRTHWPIQNVFSYFINSRGVQKTQKKLIKTQLEDISCIHYSILYTSVKFQATTAAIFSTDPM